MKTNTPKLRFPEFRNQGHWTTGNLKSICHMKAGKFISAIEIYEKYDDGLYPCYGGNGLRGYTKRYNQNGTFPLIGRQGALCGNVILGNKKFYATEHAIVVKSNDGIDVNWLYHALCWLNLNQYATGQAQPGLSVEAIEKIAVAVPPNQYEQQKIADCLSSLDGLISTESRKLDALASYKKGLMQQLFPAEGETVPKLRFPEFRNAPAWGKRAMENCFTERQETGYTDIPLLSLTDKDGIVLQAESNRKDNSNTDKSKYLRICPSDIVYNTMRMWEGRSALAQMEGLVSPAYTVCKPKKHLHSQFFAFYFKTYHAIKLFEKYSQGLVKDTLNLKFKAFSQIDLLVPEVDEQKKIANCLASLDELIAMQTEKLDSLKNFKKGMMQQLFPVENENAI